MSNDLISRRAIYNNIGDDVLLSYLREEDIQACGLYLDDEKRLFLTEEQGRAISALNMAFRRFINDFPAVENIPIMPDEDVMESYDITSYDLYDSNSLPDDVARLIVFENVVESFNPSRYWVSEREKKVLADILSLNSACELLADANIPFLNATLLWGQSGTGKTQFGRYLAYSLKLPFAYVNLCNLVGASLGETGRNLRTIFDFVQQTPCVFMLDEIDAIGCNRGSIGTGGSGDEMTRTTIALMQCLDRVRRDVVLLAATNRKDMLDSAVLRRFTAVHELKAFLPDESIEMIKSYLEDVKQAGGLDITWDEEDIKAQCQIYRAQAELINLCNRAIVRAVQGDNVIRLTLEDEHAKKNRWN